MAKTVSTAEFMKSFKAKAGKKFNNFKTAEDQGGGGLPDGRYEGNLVECSLNLDKNKNPYVMFKFGVVSPENLANRIATKMHSIAEQGARTVEMCLEMLSVDFQRLGVDVSQCEIDDLPAICEHLSQSKPLVSFGLVTSTRQGKNGQSYTNQRLNLYGLVEGEEGGETETPDESEEEVQETEEEVELEEEIEESPPKPSPSKPTVPSGAKRPPFKKR